jgi:hypothetical protein
MRKYDRHPSDIPINYELIDVVYDQKDYLKNISIGGLCFRSNRYIQEGTTILIQIPLINPIFEGVGVVVWCEQNEAYYDVGVQFIDEDKDSRAHMIEQICYIEQYKREVFGREGRKLSGEEAAVEWLNKYVREFLDSMK